MPNVVQEDNRRILKFDACGVYISSEPAPVEEDQKEVLDNGR